MQWETDVLTNFSASQIYELGEDKENTMDFAEAIDTSDLEEFGFTDSFIFELWGAITDAKSGRLWRHLVVLSSQMHIANCDAQYARLCYVMSLNDHGQLDNLS